MPDEGFRKWLGVDYEVMEDGHAVVGLTLTDDMRNLRGVAQGGIVAAVIDIAMATAAAGGNYDTRKRPMATLEMKINYVAAANGPRLTATADVIRMRAMALSVFALLRAQQVTNNNGLLSPMRARRF